MHLHWLIVFLVSMAVTATDTTTPVLSHGTSSSTSISGRVSDAAKCSDTEGRKNLFERLGLEENYSQNTRMWPLIFHDNPEDVPYFNPFTIYVDLYVTSILNVDEKSQSLTTQVKMVTLWANSNMTWNPKDYCGINTFAAPKNMFWTPDIGIMESIKIDFGTKESSTVLLLNDGSTVSTEILSLTTTCKMDLYKFPFDTQICSITLQSTAYSDKEIKLDTLSDAKKINFKSKELFQAQGEWDLDSIKNSNATVDDDINFFQINQLKYEINIKRRPLLYVINIIIPVFFFLVLDVISFFIDTSGADKLSFKVTLLLSISVMLLILNNTLPSTAENFPLLGIFCCGIFCLIGISILETILVNYLKAKGAEKRSVETTAVITGQNDGVRDQQCCILNPLNPIRTKCWAAIQRNQRLKTCLTCLSWTKVAKWQKFIDNVFLFFYIITIITFCSEVGKRTL